MFREQNLKFKNEVDQRLSKVFAKYKKRDLKIQMDGATENKEEIEQFLPCKTF